MPSNTENLPPLVQEVRLETASFVAAWARTLGQLQQTAKNKDILEPIRKQAELSVKQIQSLPGELGPVLSKLEQQVTKALSGGPGAKSATAEMFAKNSKFIHDLAAEHGKSYDVMRAEVKKYYDDVKRMRDTASKTAGFAGAQVGVKEMEDAVRKIKPGAAGVLGVDSKVFADILQGAAVRIHEIEVEVRSVLATADMLSAAVERRLEQIGTGAALSAKELAVLKEQTKQFQTQGKTTVEASRALTASLNKARAEFVSEMQQTTTVIAALGKIEVAKIGLSGKKLAGENAAAKDARTAAQREIDNANKEKAQKQKVVDAKEIEDHRATSKTKTAQEVADIKASAATAAQANKVIADAVAANNRRVAAMQLADDKQLIKDKDAVRKVDTAHLVTDIKLQADKVRVSQKAAGQQQVNDARQIGQQVLQTDRQVGNERLAVTKGEQARLTAAKQAEEAIRIANTRRSNSEDLVHARAHAQRLTDVVRFGYKNVTLAMQSMWQNHHAKLKSSLKEDEIAVKGSMDRQAALVAQSQTGVIGFATGQSSLAMNLGMVAGGAGVGAGVLASLNAFGAVEKGMASMEVMLKRTGITAEEAGRQMDALKDKAVELGNDLSLPGVSAADAVTAMNALVMANFSVAEAMESGRSVMQLAKAQNLDFGESARTVGGYLQAFKIDAKEATTVVDMLTAAQFASGGAGFDELRMGAQQASASFSSMFRETLGGTGAMLEMDVALALLSKNMLRGSDAGTSLKTMLTRLSGATEETATLSTELAAKVGATGNLMMDASGRARPLQESFNLLRQAMVGMSEIDQTQLIGKLFGSDSARAAQIFLGSTNEELDRLKASLVDSAGLTTQLLEAQSKGWEGAKDALSSFIDTMKLLSGERIAPFATVALTNFTKALQFLAQDPSLEIVRDGLKGLALGLGAIIVAKGAIEVLGLAGKMIAAMMSGPMIVAAGIGLLASAFYSAYQNIEPFRLAVDRTVDSFKAGAVERVTAMTDAVKEFGAQAKTAFQLGGLARGGIGGLSSIHLAIASIGEAVERGKDNMALLDTTLERLGDHDFSGARDSFVLFAQEVAKPVMPVVEFVGAQLAASFEFAKTLTAQKFAEIKATIEAQLKSIQWGEIWDNMFASVSGVVGPVVAAIGTAMGAAIGKIGEFLGAHVGDILGGLFNVASKIGEFLAKTIFSEQFIKAAAAAGGALAVAAGSLAVGFIKGFVTQLWEQKGAVHKAVHDIVVFAFTGLRDIAIDNPLLAVLAAPAVFIAISALQSRLASAFGASKVGGFLGGLPARVDEAMLNTSIAIQKGGDKIVAAGQKSSSMLGSVLPAQFQSALGKVDGVVENATTRMGTGLEIAGEKIVTTTQKIKDSLSKVGEGFAIGAVGGLAMFNAQISEDSTTKAMSYVAALGAMVTAMSTGNPYVMAFTAAMLILGKVIGDNKAEQDKLNASVDKWRDIVTETDPLIRAEKAAKDFGDRVLGTDEGMNKLGGSLKFVGIGLGTFAAAVADGSPKVAEMREQIIQAKMANGEIIESFQQFQKAASRGANGYEDLDLSIEANRQKLHDWIATNDSAIVSLDSYVGSQQAAASAARERGDIEAAAIAEKNAAEAQAMTVEKAHNEMQAAVTEAAKGSASAYDTLRGSIDEARRKFMEPWKVTIFNIAEAKADLIPAMKTVQDALVAAMGSGLSITDILAGKGDTEQTAAAFNAINQFTDAFAEQSSKIAAEAPTYESYLSSVQNLRAEMKPYADSIGLSNEALDEMVRRTLITAGQFPEFQKVADATGAKLQLMGEKFGLTTNQIATMKAAVERLDLTAPTAKLAESFEGIQTAAGLTDEQVLGMIDAINGIPPEKKLEIKAQLTGLDEAGAAIQEAGYRAGAAWAGAFKAGAASAGPTISSVAAAAWGAQGGIYTSPRVMGLAEDGAEALIPLTKPARALDLMQRSGLMEFAVAAALAGAPTRAPRGDLNQAAYRGSATPTTSVPSLSVTAPQGNGVPVIGELHVHSNATDEYAVGMVVASRISGIANRVRV